ncbi:MAG: hypothetical protein WCA31_13885 [Acidimicrobiales bacterium]
MVPSSYLEFMITSAGAAGAMIGLLFVAISLRSDMVFGVNAPARVKTLAASSFTGLVNAFSLSLLAIIPTANIGVGMIVLAVICLYSTLKLHIRATGAAQYRLLILTALTYAAQLAGGVTLTVRPHTSWIVNGLCYVIFASFVLALTRAWQLIEADSPTSDV